MMKELLLSYLEVLKQDILLWKDTIQFPDMLSALMVILVTLWPIFNLHKKIFTMTMDVCLTAASGRFVSVVNFRFTSGPQTKVR